MPEEVPGLHRRAAGWFCGTDRHGQAAEAIRHTQAAGDWPDAARLLADRSLSMTLDGQAQTMQALVRALPPGEDYPELALVRAGGDLVQGRLDEAAAHLAVAETYAETAPLDRQRRLDRARRGRDRRMARLRPRRAPPRPLILSVYGSAAVTAVFVALLGWLLAETRDGSVLGLAERLTTSTQTSWPFITAVALRRTRRPPGDLVTWWC